MGNWSIISPHHYWRRMYQQAFSPLLLLLFIISTFRKPCFYTLIELFYPFQFLLISLFICTSNLVLGLISTAHKLYEWLSNNNKKNRTNNTYKSIEETKQKMHGSLIIESTIYRQPMDWDRNTSMGFNSDNICSFLFST